MPYDDKSDTYTCAQGRKLNVVTIEMLTYEELLAENRRLSEEVSKLKAENSELKAKLRITVACSAEAVKPDEGVEEKSIVNKYSSPEEKIALFSSLFAGRTDVFARRWYSVTSGKSGYQPVCGNEWDDALCDKKKNKCSACPNRKLLPLTDGDLFAHLAGKDKYGRDVVGVYPLLTDENCEFCCVDFDDEGYKTASIALYKEASDSTNSRPPRAAVFRLTVILSQNPVSRRRTA